VPEEPDGGLEGLVPLGQRPDLRVALRQPPLMLPPRSKYEPVGQIDAAPHGAGEDERPDE
jgi:hypothetical protein